MIREQLCKLFGETINSALNALTALTPFERA